MLYKKIVLCVLVLFLITSNVFAESLLLFQGIGDIVEVGNSKIIVNYAAYTDKINTFNLSKDSKFAIINFDVYVTDIKESVWMPVNFYKKSSCVTSNIVFTKNKSINSNEWYNAELVVIIDNADNMDSVTMLDPITNKETIIKLKEIEKVVF